MPQPFKNLTKITLVLLIPAITGVEEKRSEEDERHRDLHSTQQARFPEACKLVPLNETALAAGTAHSADPEEDTGPGVTHYCRQAQAVDMRRTAAGNALVEEHTGQCAEAGRGIVEPAAAVAGAAELAGAASAGS